MESTDCSSIPEDVKQGENVADDTQRRKHSLDDTDCKESAKKARLDCGEAQTEDNPSEEVPPKQRPTKKEKKEQKRKLAAQHKQEKSKRNRETRLAEKEEEDDLPMNVPYKVIDGVRHLSPYWCVYRTRTKGRWLGRPLVDVFQQEFLSLNKHYAKVAAKLGRIRVNGQPLRDLSYVMKNGDRIEHIGHRHEHPVLDQPIRVIADTDDLIVLDKPCSLPVHACGQYAIHTILAQLRIEHGVTGLRVLHRLDRTTSGILMFAKNYETDIEFKQTLKQGEWTKEYVCKVEGVFPEEEVVCEQPLGILVVSMGIQCVRREEDGGKHARTRFRRLWTDGKTSVLKATIDTGRTHQIRVHAQYLGHPIVNDQLYNQPYWGPSKGKGAEYGKSYEQLCADVRDAHKQSLWLESVDAGYEERMERMAEEEGLPMDSAGLWSGNARPDYDPICLQCNVTKRKVPMGHFSLYLHCLKYETEKWSYSTPMPEWAREQEEQKEQGGDGGEEKCDSVATAGSV